MLLALIASAVRQRRVVSTRAVTAVGRRIRRYKIRRRDRPYAVDIAAPDRCVGGIADGVDSGRNKQPR